MIEIRIRAKDCSVSFELKSENLVNSEISSTIAEMEYVKLQLLEMRNPDMEIEENGEGEEGEDEDE